MQTDIDRTTVPEAGPMPAFELLDETRLSRRTLSNGLDLWLYRYTKLPIVHVNLVVHSGGYSDPVTKAGMTNLLTEMLDEGTETRSALEIADDFEYLGTKFNTWASMDGCGISLLTLREHLAQSLDIFSDIILHPQFPDAELMRVRQKILTSILQERDQPNVVATKVFIKTIYGREHPYAYPITGTRESVQGVTAHDLREKYDLVFRPNNASVIVVGDVTLEDITNTIESVLAGWKQNEIPSIELPVVPDHEQSLIYLVDHPGAVQSQIRVGHRGIERTHKDYFPIRVMNQILGGQFTSRLNLNLREEKGYTYGTASMWEMYKYGGHFMTSGAFQGEFTDKSVAEIMKELHRIRDDGVTEEELEAAKDGLIRSLPRQFETPAQIASKIGSVALYRLQQNYFQMYIEQIRSVSIDEVNQAARSYIYPSKVTIAIVGDVGRIKAPLVNLGLGEVIEIDHEG